MADLIDRSHHLPVDRIVQYLFDETAVDLEVVDRKVLQVSKGGQARPEIVKSELAAELLECVDESICLGVTRDRSRFGDLEADFGRIDAAHLELVDNERQKLLVAKALPRKINRAKR